MTTTPPSSAQTTEAVPARLLIVDDDPQMRAMLRQALERHGFEVHEAASGEQVLQALESVRPDAIVLDKEMPGVSGFEVLGLIRQHDVAVPVIVITAFGGLAVRAEALRRGATAYVEKPFRVNALVEQLLAVTEGRGPRSASRG
ncbi:MAG: response regulator [candidate division NC10 bacterium]